MLIFKIFRFILIYTIMCVLICCMRMCDCCCLSGSEGWPGCHRNGWTEGWWRERCM